MKLLHNLLLEAEYDELEEIVEHLVEQYVNHLNEAVTPLPQDGDVMELLKMAEDRLAAARRGLGLANKMPPEQKGFHQSRILGNLNSIKGIVNKLQKRLQAQLDKWEPETNNAPPDPALRPGAYSARP